MKDLIAKLQNWLAGPFSTHVQKLTSNIYLRALQSCFTTILPMIIVGSLANLINTLRNFVSWMPDLSLINTLTFGLISIFMAYLIPYNIMENKRLNKQKNNYWFCRCFSFICFSKPSIC